VTNVTPRKTTQLEVNEADDGLVVYDPTRDMVHHLNPSAAMIFELCDGTRDADAIAGLLGEAFGLDAPPHEQTLAGLQELAERNLIHEDAHLDAPD
jgi:hypothetical protein